MTQRTRWIGLTLFIGVCLGAGGLGAMATTPEIEGWYKTIAKPSWNPPGYVFGPMWTTLYIMMASGHPQYHRPRCTWQSCRP